MSDHTRNKSSDMGGAQFYRRQYLYSTPEPYKLYLAIIQVNNAILKMMKNN